MGAVVEDSPLVSSLWDELKNDDRIDLLDNVQIKSINAPSPSTMGNIEPPPPVNLSITQSSNNNDEDECKVLSTNVLVAADGANSLVRRTVGTFPMTTRSYGRKAVTCTVELESSMAHTAFQRFLPHGPIALLPVWNSQDDNNKKERRMKILGSDQVNQKNLEQRLASTMRSKQSSENQMQETQLEEKAFASDSQSQNQT